MWCTQECVNILNLSNFIAKKGMLLFFNTLKENFSILNFTTLHIQGIRVGVKYYNLLKSPLNRQLSRQLANFIRSLFILLWLIWKPCCFIFRFSWRWLLGLHFMNGTLCSLVDSTITVEHHSLSWIWRTHIPLKCWHPCVELHGVTSLKVVTFTTGYPVYNPMSIWKQNALP